MNSEKIINLYSKKILKNLENYQDFEKKFDELSNLLIENKNKNYQIGMSLMSMYDHCDDFDPNSNSLITDEENLRNYAKILLSELKRA